MIATSVPADIFAAPLADEDVIFEEGADAVEALGAADEELVVEEAVDPVDPDDAKGGVTVAFLADSADTTLNANIYQYNDLLSHNYPLGGVYSYTADPDKDWTLVVEPKEGYAFLETEPLTVTGAYVSYANDAAGEDVTVTAGATTIELKDLEPYEATYCYRGSKKVIIHKELLDTVVKTMDDKDTTTDDGILTLKFPKTAKPAQYDVAGYDLKDIEAKASPLPSDKKLVCGPAEETSNIDLTKVLEVGALDTKLFKVAVAAYNKDGEIVVQSPVLDASEGNTPACATDVNATDTTAWLTKANPSGTKVWAQYNQDGTVKISKAATTYFYNAGYDVYLDVTAGAVGVVNVKTNSASEAVATFTTATGINTDTQWTGAIKSNADCKNTANLNKDMLFDLAVKSPDYTYINSVTWTVAGKSDDSYKFTVAPGKATLSNVKIPKGDLAKGDVVVTVTGAYKVEQHTTDSTYRILNKDGAVLTQTEAKKDLEFQIAMANGKKVNSVSYYVGSSDDVESISPETDGSFKIPAAQVTGDIKILPSTSTVATGEMIVGLADTYSELTVRKLDDAGTQITKGGVASKVGEPVLFTITPGSNIVEKVEYSVGSGSTSFTDISTPIYGKTYKIPAISDTNKVTLKITYHPALNVFASSNKKVKIKLANDTDYMAPGAKKAVLKGSLNFTVTPVDDTVKVTGIYFENSKNNFSDSKKISSTTGGTVDVSGDSDWYINVKTEETVPADGFRAEFTDGTNPAKLVKTYEEGKTKTTINLKSQELKLVMGDPAQTITGVFYPIKTGKLREAIGTTDSITAPDTTDILTLDKAAIKITPKKVGTQEVTVSGKIADGSDGNVLVYPGKLNVSVTQAYTDLTIRGVDTAYTFDGTNNDADDLDVATYVMMGKNGQTGVYEPVLSSEIKSIAWSFVPSTDQIPSADYDWAFIEPTSEGHAVAVSNGASGVTGNTAFVASKKSATVKVKCIVTFKDNSEEVVTKDVTFIDPLPDKYFVTRTVTGAKDDFSSISSGDAMYYAGDLAVQVADKNSITVKYDIYKVLDTTAVLPVTNTYNAAEIKAFLDQKKIEKVEDKDLTIGDAKLTNRNSYGAVNYADSTAYANLEKTTDGYKISAVKSNNGSTTSWILFSAPTVKVDGITVPTLNYKGNDVGFAVEEELNRYRVELITVDDQSKDGEGNAVNLKQTLSTAYVAGRDKSEVKAKLSGWRKSDIIGYEFLGVGEGVDFKLPEESDFETKPYSKKMLLGWAVNNWDADNAGTIYDYGEDGFADSVLAPGEHVTIWGNYSFTAIWTDKYVKFTGTAGSTSGKLIRFYDKTKSYVDSNNKTQYPVEIVDSDNIELGSNIDVVIAVGKVTGISTGNDNKVYNIEDKKVDIDYLTVEPAYYTADKFTLTAADDDAAHNLDATKLAAGTIASKEGTATGVNTKITAKWTDPAVTTDEYKDDKTIQFIAAKEATITLSPAPTNDKYETYEMASPITMSAALVDKDVHASTPVTLTAADGNNEGTNRRYYNYTYNWTSSAESVATVKAGEKQNQGTAVITPGVAGKTTIGLEIMKDGRVIASKSFELTVKASDVAITFADMSGTTGITEVQARAGYENKSLFKVKATHKDGTVISGVTYKFGGDVYATNKVIANDQDSVALTAGDDNFMVVNVKTKDFVGTDKLHVTVSYTESGKSYTFQKDIDVKTYYSVLLNPVANTWITVNGVKQANADGSNKPVEIKLFEGDMKDVKETAYSKDNPINKKDFNFKEISLKGYSAVGVDGSKTEFSNWVVDMSLMNKTNPAVAATVYKQDATISKLIGYGYVASDPAVDNGAKSKSNFESGKGYYALKPVMAKVVAVTGVPGTITMNYKDNTDGYIGKKVIVNTDPANYGTESEDRVAFTVSGTKAGFYAIADSISGGNANKTTVPSGNGKVEFVIKAYTEYNSLDETSWTAGTDVLKIYGPNKSKELAAITLNVNGLNYDGSTKKVQYFENGELVKSDFRTVEGNTYYFDADGNWIKTTGITKINGKDVLIVNGVVASKGPQTLEGNKYFVGDNGILLTGWLTSTGEAATAANGVYYADPANSGKLVSGLQTIDGKKYMFGADNKVSRASATADTYELVNGVYVNAAGEIAENGIFKVAGVDRLFRADGSIVCFGDADVDADGKITLNGQKYTIEKGTHKAVRDDILYNPVVTWIDRFPTKVTKGTAAPTLKYSISYTSKAGNTVTPVEKTVVATTTDNFEAGSTAESVTFTATPDLTGFFADAEGTTPAIATPLTVTYKFKDGGTEGVLGTYTYKGHKFTWNDIVSGADKPVVTATVDYTLTTDEGSSTVIDTPTVAIEKVKSDGKTATFTATITLMDGSTKSETKKYDLKTGKIATSESGKTVSEPDENGYYNIFYTDVAIELPLPDGAVVDGASGNWTKYYKIEDGVVTVTASSTKDRKAAAQAKNSLIVLPIKDGETVIGEFEYQLPVSYAAPKLKLSSTSGKVNKSLSADQATKTVVLEKKSTGAFEALDLSDQKDSVALWSGKKGTATAEAGDNAGEVIVTAKDAASGQIVVQLDNWSDSVNLNYKVTGVAKDVVTASVKTLNFNVNATSGEAQEFTVLLNGNEIGSEEDGVTVDLKKWAKLNLELEGVNESGQVTGSEIKIAYKSESAPAKGSYTLKFTKGKGVAASVKVVVSNAALDKAVTYKTQAKMNLVTGQKMVLIPQFKGISGEISDVKFDDTSATLFDVEYNEDLGQIIVAPAEGATLSSKTQYAPTITTTVGGVECTSTVKFKPVATKPTVKIAGLTLPKANVAKADAAASLISTYKLGGKTFSIAPSAVKFTNGPAVEGEDGWFIDSKTNAKVHYDAENGVIEVKANDAEGAAAIKKGSVNIEISFAGLEKPVKKTLSIKVK
jgi:hypothetical protein